mgnify:CR=1 FL=1
MEITFVWSWLSFWLGFASFFLLVFISVLFFGIRNAVKQAKRNNMPAAGSLDDLITWRKNK